MKLCYTRPGVLHDVVDGDKFLHGVPADQECEVVMVPLRLQTPDHLQLPGVLVHGSLDTAQLQLGAGGVPPEVDITDLVLYTNSYIRECVELQEDVGECGGAVLGSPAHGELLPGLEVEHDEALLLRLLLSVLVLVPQLLDDLAERSLHVHPSQLMK